MNLKLILLFFTFLTPFFCLAQYTIDDHYMEFTDVSSTPDFYSNTYLNAESDVSVEWVIVRDSMPTEWEFSNCFPSCYAPGTLSGTNSFEAGSQTYLNCHFYPNNVAGQGLVQMQITITSIVNSVTNTDVDTVTWRGTATEPTAIGEWHSNTNNPVVAIYNLLGQKIDRAETNQVHIVRYKDGTIRKSINRR